jgi:hypothetical protein
VAGGSTAAGSTPSEPAGPQGDAERRRSRWRWTPVLVVIVGLLLGAGVAVGLNDALGIVFVDRDRPVDPVIDVAAVPAPAPFELVAAVVVDGGDEWLARGAARVADALEARTGERPEVVASEQDAPAGRRLLVAGPDATVGPDPTVDPDPTADPDATVGPTTAAASTPATTPRAESFAVEADGDGLVLRAASRDGQLVGLAWLADHLATGTAEADLVGVEVTPDLPLRLVDLGGLGVPRDPADWDPTDYSHDVRRFETARLPDPPWIDAAAFAAIEDDFVDYLDRMRSYGNNGIVADGFLEFIDLDGVGGDGQAVYPPTRRTATTTRRCASTSAGCGSSPTTPAWTSTSCTPSWR